MIRLLIADDSALMRKLLERIFLDEGDFDIRLARNGNEALELVRTFDPEVVTLDVAMPGMDGLTCLSRIMIEAPRPVVMISSLTEEGAEATLEAIDLGAVDFVAKPSGTVSLEIDRLRPVLVEKVRAAAFARIRRTLRLTERVRHRIRGAGLVSQSRPGLARPKMDTRVGTGAIKAGNGAPPGLVLIGISTGGPAALDVVLPQLPPDFPWPVLVAQHLPASFTGAFAKRLDRECHLDVVEVNQPMPLKPGTIYIGKGDADVTVAPRLAGVIAMPVPAKASHLWHPSVERMVASALEHLDASRLIGVMMTGMGNDGAEAMKRLRLAGGRTIAEAESSAIVWGMPGELVRNGGAEKVRPLEDIAATIIEMVNSHAPG
ncbi:chemotaxis-specific protein-glutamate methyltransferase CheB [Bradyrhizobium sp.]|uniref:chemotaxis-specific protein-glutamate methyltransferase CheB n=1 Tax=Bradyrhizobium sp. TaxID=376 RepID=UPI003C2055CF